MVLLKEGKKKAEDKKKDMKIIKKLFDIQMRISNYIENISNIFKVTFGSIFMGFLYFYLNSRICGNNFFDLLMLFIPTMIFMFYPLLYINYKKNIKKAN